MWRECAHRNDTQKIGMFSPTQRPLINIHCNNKDQQILCKPEYGWTFFWVCKPLQKNKILFLFNFKIYSIPVQSNHPNIIQYYILHEKNKPLSVFYLSLSSIAQHNLNHNLNKKSNRNIQVISKQNCHNCLNCHQIHLKSCSMTYRNIHCTDNGEYASLISNW